MSNNFIFMLCGMGLQVAQAESVMKGFLVELGYD
jgi:hypothetical protein